MRQRNAENENTTFMPNGEGSHVGGWLIVVLGTAVFLRLFRLGSRDFWHDEVHNLVKSTQIGRVVFEGDMVSNHPPLFALLLTAWRGLGVPEGEFSMRLLPAILGILGVAAVFRLGRELYGARAGLFGAFLLAIAPLHVFHSQDLKTYILLPLTATVTVYILYRAVQANSIGRWALYSVWAALACYSDLYAAPLLISINLWVLLQLHRRKRRLRNWFFANLAGAFLFLPQLGIMLTKFNTVLTRPEHWWVPEATFSAVAFYIKAIAFGYSDLDPFFKIAMLAFGAFGLAGLYLGIRRNSSGTVLLVLCSALSVSIVFVLSLVLDQSIFLIRALIPYSIPVFILTGLGIARLPAKPLRFAATILFSALAAMPLVEHYVGTYPQSEFPHRPGIHAPVAHKLLTEHILDGWKEGDVVLTTTNASWLPCYWYGLKDRPIHFASFGSDFIDFFHANNPRTTDREDFDAYFPRDVRTLLDGKNRVWLVLSEWERAYLQNNPQRVWRWVDGHYTQIAHASFENIELFLYAKEDHGKSIHTRRRDEDDGLSARMTYSSDRLWSYVRSMPDLGSVQTAEAERRGNLTLRFSDDHSESLARLEDASRTRRVSFEIENRLADPVNCRIHVVPGDYLIDLASLESHSSDSDVWSVTGMYAPYLDNEFYDLPVAAAHHRAPGTYTISSVSEIAAGQYEGRVYALGSPGNTALRRASYELSVNGTPVTTNIPRARDSVRGWNWFATPPISVEPGPENLRLQASVSGLKDGNESWAALAYLSLKRRGESSQTPESPRPTDISPGDVDVPGAAVLSWTVEVDADIRRVDVWVYELAPQGRAYRIFTQLGPEDELP